MIIIFELMELQGTFKNQAFGGRYRYTRVWRNQGEIWQIVAAHISSVPSW